MDRRLHNLQRFPKTQKLFVYSSDQTFTSKLAQRRNMPEWEPKTDKIWHFIKTQNHIWENGLNLSALASAATLLLLGDVLKVEHPC